MTELVRVPEHLPSRPEPGLTAGVAALQQWADTAKAAATLIDQIVDTPFFPDSLRARPAGNTDLARAAARGQSVANGTGAVLYGVEIGLSPMQALNNVIVIHGRPSLYAETMVALVQAAGHEIWTESVTDTAAVVCGRRDGSPVVERVEFTMERARKAGYTRNEKYQKDPQAMLYARAASIACRRTAPEVLKGIASFEEVQDDQRPPRPALAPVAASAPVTVAEITGSAPAEAEPGDAADEAAAAVTAEQRNLIGTALDTLTVAADHRRRVVSLILGRDVAGIEDISTDEADRLCAELAALAGNEDGPLLVADMLREDGTE